MNKRIKELMTQAGFDPAAIERMGVMPNAEKFAELIVRECAKQICEAPFYAGAAAKYIKQHFGVEQ